ARHATVLGTLLPLAIAAVVLAVHLALTVAHVDRARFTFDSAEYAIAGRDLACTGRLTTPFAYPVLLRESGRPPFALVAGHPLTPLLDALLFRVAGPRPWLTLIPSALAYLVAIGLALRLARRVTGAATAAAIAAALAFSPMMLFYAAEGVSEMPFTALTLGAVLLLAGLRDRPRPFWLGVSLGLGHLARPVVLPLLPVWLAGAAWLAAPAQRRRTVALV